MLVRLLLLLVAVVLVARWVLRVLAAGRAGAADPEGGAVREMVQDPVCHLYVSRASALTTIAGGRVHYFCSADCYRRFLGAGAAR